MKRTRRNRRGAAVLEMSIILSVFVILTFGMLDLGIGVLRYHILANAARQGARSAIVHGKQAAALGPWSTDTIDHVPATTANVPIIDGVTSGGSKYGMKYFLAGCDLANTKITAEWLDASNAYGKRVRVTVESPYRPFMTFLLVPTTLKAVSTMQIAH
jgi:Flp pilus assembly protein TadG